jgi:hypothetical protein
MQDNQTRVSSNDTTHLKKLKQNAKILRRICINKRFSDLSKKTDAIQQQLENYELNEQSDELVNFRKDLFDIAFDMDKRLERKSSEIDDTFSFSVMFA